MSTAVQTASLLRAIVWTARQGGTEAVCILALSGLRQQQVVVVVAIAGAGPLGKGGGTQRLAAGGKAEGMVFS